MNTSSSTPSPDQGTNKQISLFDNKLRQLKVQFRRHMNGVVANLMRNASEAYKGNYGVSIQHLREISTMSDFSPEECDKLWDMGARGSMGARELMLIAVLSLKPEGMTVERLTAWAATATIPETIEVMAFSKTGRATEVRNICDALVANGRGRCIELALQTASRSLQNGADDATEVAKNLMSFMEGRLSWNVAEANSVGLLCRMAIRKNVLKEMVDALCRLAQGMQTEQAQRFLYDVETERMAWE